MTYLKKKNLPERTALAFTLVSFQGDVIKTRSGGQAVQFTDIETLKQELATVPRYQPVSSSR